MELNNVYLVWLEWPEKCFRVDAEALRYLRTAVPKGSRVLRTRSEAAFLKALPKATHAITWHFKADWFAKAPRLKESLPYLTLLKPNRYEAELLSGVAIKSEDDIRTAAEAMLATGLKRVCISLSEEGLYLLDQSGEELRERLPATFTVCNTTGCGDAMTAALACAMAEGLTMQEAAKAAIRVAVLTAASAETISPELNRNVMFYS